jgi:ribosome-associated translation inhibitor RaiA
MRPFRNPSNQENFSMQIQVNTSNGIENNDSLARWAQAELLDTLAHFKGDLTRVEVHLSNESASKAGGDTRCAMEARLAHHQPVAVSHHAPTQDAAFRGASDKLKSALDKTLGRLRSHRNHESLARDGVAVEE